jgi:UTP:GlnB (protein PII) uridylyltransferase
MAALKDLGLNIKKMSMDCTSEEAEVCSLEKVFYVTDAKTSEKVVASAQLQEMKDTIMACMMEFHPEAKEKVSKADVSVGGVVAKLGPKVDASIPTSIKIRAGARNVRSVMDLVTADRPGLLVNVVKVIKDISVNVVSAEVDTIVRVNHPPHTHAPSTRESITTA